LDRKRNRAAFDQLLEHEPDDFAGRRSDFIRNGFGVSHKLTLYPALKNFSWHIVEINRLLNQGNISEQGF